MKKIVLLLAAVILALTNINAQEAKSLLWRISGNGLTRPSYIFGTIHLICPSDYVWTSKMQHSLNACNKVCFEMDLDDPAVMSAATAGFIDMSGKRMKDYFKPADYDKLAQFMHDSVGMDMAMLQSMKPIALESIISMRSVKCMDAVSYEERIMAKAKAKKKEVMGLEPVSEQIAALDNMPTDSVVAEIMESVNNFSKSKHDFNDLVEAYKTQDLPLLYQKIMATGGSAEDMGMLLNDRNKRWIERMTKKMKGNAVFFAVGAGHLAGDVGVLTLLRKAGYNVEPVL